jgi:hypothetical protein
MLLRTDSDLKIRVSTEIQTIVLYWEMHSTCVRADANAIAVRKPGEIGFYKAQERLLKHVTKRVLMIVAISAPGQPVVVCRLERSGLYI